MTDARLSARPRRNRKARMRRMGDEQWVALGPDVYVLTEVGAEVWRLSDGSRAVDDIVDAVVRSYDVERGVAVADVEAFLTDLERCDLIGFGTDGAS